MVEFVLSAADAAEAERIARGRMVANVAAGRESLKASRSQSDERVHRVGAFCEVGVARVEDRPIRCEVYAGDDWRSATAGDDVAGWEIKGSEWWGKGRLLVPERYAHKHKMGARYLLVWCNLASRRGCIVGWAWGHELIRPERLDRSLPIPAYAMGRADLHPYP